MHRDAPPPSAPLVVSPSPQTRYEWGAGCEAWRLLDDPALAVHLEVVPPGAGETAHRHRHARQFFYILSGTAQMDLNGQSVTLEAGQGMHVPPGCVHRFHNAGPRAVRFLVVSAPSSRHDRVAAAR